MKPPNEPPKWSWKELLTRGFTLMEEVKYIEGMDLGFTFEFDNVTEWFRI